MRGRHRESELVEAPPHRAEIGFSSVPCGPLPARGARNAVPAANADPSRPSPDLIRGLSRAPTSQPCDAKDAGGRDKPGHDDVGYALTKGEAR
jgi:hypothetical protein